MRGSYCWATALALTLTACAHTSPYEPADPLEKINRPIYAFNVKADRYVLRPVAVGYVKVVPSPVRNSVSNFLDNLFYPTVIVNDVLQAKFSQSGQDLGRFAMNTTFGVLGLFDPATRVGLMKHEEDLGQTLGYWGVGTGWYLMLPILGPTTNRDLVGRVGDIWTSPLQYSDNVDFKDRVIVTVVQGIDDRSKLLDIDKMLDQQLDPYVFIRTAYLQQRLSKVYDGNPPADLMDPPLPED